MTKVKNRASQESSRQSAHQIGERKHAACRQHGGGRRRNYMIYMLRDRGF